MEGQYPSIVVPAKSFLPSYVPPSPGETPTRLSSVNGSSTPSLRPTTKTPTQYAAVPPLMTTSYQQLLTDLASLRANNIAKISPPHDPIGLQWTNPAVQKFYETKTLLGLDPDFILPRSQGFALWMQPRGKYYSFEVRDHRTPFVVRFPKQLREKTIKHLHKTTPSAWYERNAGLIGVQTDSLDQAILTLALIKAYDQGQRLPEEVRKEVERERADTTKLESPIRDALERYVMAEN